MKAQTFWRIAFALLLVFITWQTLTPDPDDTEPSIAIARFIAKLLFGGEELSDKVAHFLAYAALGGSAALGRLKLFQRFWPVAAALVAYGVVLEGLQGFSGVRDPELLDAVANALGAGASFAAGHAIHYLLARKAAA